MVASQPTWAQQAIELNVLDFGAEGDGVTDDTVAIRKTFAACAAGGAGESTVVVFPAAHTFLTGPFNVSCSNVVVRFHGNVQAVSKAVSDPGVWPVLSAYPSYGGRDRAHPFIYIVEQTNVTLTGTGTVDGAGATWWALSKSLAYDAVGLLVQLSVGDGQLQCPWSCTHQVHTATFLLSKWFSLQV